MRDNTLRAAPFFPRAAAWLLDRLILGVLLFVPRITVLYGKMGTESLSRAFLFRYTLGDVVLWVLAAAYFVILTAVEKVSVNFRRPDQKDLDSMTVSEAREYIAQGHFAPGSMLPKVESCISFVENTDAGVALITSLEKAREALLGKTGTRIVKG